MALIHTGEAVEGPASRESSERRRRYWPWIVGLAALVLVIVAVRAVGAKRAANDASARGRDANRTVPVTTAPARTGDVPVYLRGIGTVTGFKTATVRSRVDGQLLRVNFKEGQHVQEGDLLAEIDPRPFEVQIEQAEGQLARDRATLIVAQTSLARTQALFDQGIVSQQDLDTSRSQAGQAEGALKADEAGVHNARLQLSYSRIAAPFGGRVGLRLVDPGNMVHASDQSGLLLLTQVHPIAVLFSLPQDDLPRVMSKLRSGEKLPVEAYDRDNSTRLAAGTLATIDNQIDATTGTYKLKAIFDNHDDALFPNQFVNVRLRLDTRQGLVLVPAAAVQRGSQGSFLFVVGADGVAHARPVKVALNEGTDAALESGLQAGETVVVDGQDKLEEGSKVDTGGKPDAESGGEQSGADKKAPGGARSGGRHK